MPKHLARRTVGYGLIPLAGILTPLVALPVLTAEFGGEAWAAVAIGQSVGAALATIVELGWGLNGPQRVARMRMPNSYIYAKLSLYARVIVFSPASLLGAMLAGALAPEHREVASLTAIGATAYGLSLAWFFLGKSQPWLLVATDSAVRLLFIGGASVVMAIGGGLWAYPVVGLLIPSAVAPIIGLLTISRSTNRAGGRVTLRLVIRVIMMQVSAMSTRTISALYIALPVTLVSIVAPASVAVFAAGERLMRLWLSGLSIVPNSMQGWVGSALDAESRWRRVRSALALNVGLGVVSAIVFGFAAPFASEVIFSGTATIPPALAWIVAGTVLTVCISRATGNIALVALRSVRSILISAIVGAAIGVPLLLWLALEAGYVGGAIGELVAEVAVLVMQCVAIYSLRTSSTER